MMAPWKDQIYVLPENETQNIWSPSLKVNMKLYLKNDLNFVQKTAAIL